MKPISITVVTICLNAEECIAKTIESVLSQKNESFEYVIWDGRSTDRTLDIVNQYRIMAESNSVKIQVHSENDNGIYDAMNKAVDMAKGNWILFLNAGDYFYTSDSLNQLSNHISNDLSVIYGDVLYTYYNRYKPFYSKSPDKIVTDYIFCHQSVLTRKELLQRIRFNTDYTICADYDLYLNAYLNGYKFQHISHPICIYDNNGFSSRNLYLDSHLERLEIQYRNGLINQKDLKQQSLKERLIRIIPGFLERRLPNRLFMLLISPVLSIKGWSKAFIAPYEFYDYDNTSINTEELCSPSK